MSTVTNESPMFRCPDGSAVKFQEVAVQNKAKSDVSGRPIYWTSLQALIYGPGMKNQVAAAEIHLRDETGKVVRRSKERLQEDGTPIYRDEVFKEQLKAWKDGRDDALALGTPLRMYPRLDVAQIASLEAIGIKTLEQLAEVPDSQLHQMINGRSFRDGAKAYLEAAAGGAPMDRMVAKIAELEEKLKIMAERPQAETEATTEEPKRRGRPPKDQAA